MGASTTGEGSYASEIHTISPVYRIGKGRIFLHILIHVLDGVREFIVNIFAVSFYISCLQEGDGKRFFAGLLFFCGINLALRGVSRWYRECYSERSDILQEGRIVHRLSVTALTDRIYVMEHGRITECGSHQELLVQKGRYWQMCEKQTKGYASHI